MTLEYVSRFMFPKPIKKLSISHFSCQFRIVEMWIRKRTTFEFVKQLSKTAWTQHRMMVHTSQMNSSWDWHIHLWYNNLSQNRCRKKPCVNKAFYCSRYILNQSKTWLKLRKAKCLFMGMEWLNYILHFLEGKLYHVRLNEVHFLILQITKVRAEDNNWNT